jgi:hypothetical protein
VPLLAEIELLDAAPGSSSLHRDHTTQQAADTDTEAEEKEPAAFEETALLAVETDEE